MRIQELREKTDDELRKALTESRESLRSVRFGIAERETKNHQEYRKLRRDIARMLTLARERASER